jgi:hypothetical protein
VQYVPHAFGWKGMNVPFCLWLNRQRRRDVWVMFHEVLYPRLPGQPWRHRLLARVTRRMARLTLRAARRVFVSVPAWEPILRSLGPDCPAVTWLPVLSNIPASFAVPAEKVTDFARLTKSKDFPCHLVDPDLADATAGSFYSPVGSDR